jgi:hypothetical protein
LTAFRGERTRIDHIDWWVGETMANTLIVPGVQVSVVKDVLPQQLAPSGVLGLIGFTAIVPAEVERASSLSRLTEVFGTATVLSLPEARQALDNGVSELVISPLQLADRIGATAKVKLTIKDGSTTLGSPVVVAARAPGPWANNLQLVVAVRDAAKLIVDLKIVRDQQDLEVFRNVAVGQIAAKLNSDSRLVVVPDPAPGDAVDGDRLQGGKDASADAYKAAIDRLRNEADVDLVLAAIQDFGNADTVVDIYSAVISHCNNMADAAKGRIGFGQVPPATNSQNAVTMASKLISDRFVLLAPSGVAGATAGLVGNLTYFYSPTFKVVTGLKAQKMDVEDQKALLKGHVVPVAFEQGKGTIVLRGLTTDGDQISVRRVADRAVRGVKMLGELFIGRLNNADGRSALKQKIVEFFLQMQKDGAIVPSTDGSDPAFKVNVYSSQDDFALGIVRVDVAVRPVRAIDYIYATIQVQI